MLSENFIETIQAALVNNWDRPAFSDYGTTKTMTYGDVAAEIARIHLILRGAGIHKNDKVALIGRNNSNWVTTYLATITYGAIIVPILQDFKPNDVLHIINHSESRLLFISDLLYENLDISQMEQVCAVMSLANYDVLASKGIEASAIMPDAIDNLYRAKYTEGVHPEHVHYTHKENSEIASINYTSGTTGFSKGVITPLNALAGNVKFCSENHVVYHESRQVVFLPLAHSFGCAFDFLTSFCVGAHSYFIGRTPSTKVLLQAFAEIRPTCIFAVPLILEKIYKQQILPILNKSSLSWVLKMPLLDEVVLSKIRQTLMEAFGGQFDEVIIGGAPLNQEVDDFLKRIRFPYTVGYGMTECAPLISYSKSYDYKPFSCGKPLPHLMEVRIEDPDDSGIGEIVVHGENVMMGYYKNPAATREVFTSDGWLRTGDLGYLDKDGYLFIKGRNKTMLLGPNGQNIYPEEIESRINNMPYVMESLVVKHANGLAALICPDYVAADADHLSREMLEAALETNRRNVNAQLANYEQIVEVILYPHEFEKTPKKNIKRFLYTQI